MIIVNLLLSIISDLSINMRIYSSSSYYRIINIKNIGEPSEIYVDSDKIETRSNIQYYYSNDYLIIESYNRYYSYNIKLVWKTEISNDDIMPNSETITDILIGDTMTQEISTANIYEPEKVINYIPKNFTLNASHMFDGCSSIQTIDFTDFDTTIIYNMSYMFYNCKRLTQVKNLSPINVQNMSYSFCFCHSLTKIDFIYPESINTSQVMDMKYMFYYCERLTFTNYNFG